MIVSNPIKSRQNGAATSRIRDGLIDKSQNSISMFYRADTHACEIKSWHLRTTEISLEFWIPEGERKEKGSTWDFLNPFSSCHVCQPHKTQVWLDGGSYEL